ncbi:hypothetical protein ANOM_000142 [Aspergillus nomiae NRRL 13137]|uniref:Hemopexin n=1 Tax=Aspergillus nomiae NRRL (strain ATCC 15546 / NRRL 13137 / CBS 260.88 / M93) TaxID=1509407 RepID=A0A0L1JIC1_ASPN3|nr:uncharacterized protein ANOM_000142 [Aspergillus nomiae NRRL 13137]KNG91509.1 hypothetical protein ANOM_000142 [Aspergillus nomiae NRRL 13137]
MVDAAYRIPGTSMAYIWSGTNYIKVNFTPGKVDSVLRDTASIRSTWKSLNKAGFGTVDAVVPVPDTESSIYVFSGAKYLRLKLDLNTWEDTLEYGEPSLIVSSWKSLKKVGFDRVDAAMVVPGSKKNIYFFRGLEWVDVSVDDTIISQGTIAESWPSLVQAGFDTVDAILPNNDDTYYFFSGDQFARIKMPKDEDTLVSKPESISSRNTLKHWV